MFINASVVNDQAVKSSYTCFDVGFYWGNNYVYGLSGHVGSMVTPYNIFVMTIFFGYIIIFLSFTFRNNEKRHGFTVVAWIVMAVPMYFLSICDAFISRERGGPAFIFGYIIPNPISLHQTVTLLAVLYILIIILEDRRYYLRKDEEINLKYFNLNYCSILITMGLVYAIFSFFNGTITNSYSSDTFDIYYSYYNVAIKLPNPLGLPGQNEPYYPVIIILFSSLILLCINLFKFKFKKIVEVFNIILASLAIVISIIVIKRATNCFLVNGMSHKDNPNMFDIAHANFYLCLFIYIFIIVKAIISLSPSLNNSLLKIVKKVSDKKKRVDEDVNDSESEFQKYFKEY